MAILKHELWKDASGLPMLCLAGPDGDGARQLLGSGATLVGTFEAACHFEAMTRFHERMGWGAYTTIHEWDRQPYPEEWLVRQLGGRR